MPQFIHLIRRRWSRGVTAIEYALIAALVAVAIVGALVATGTSLGDVYNNVMTSIGNALQN